MTKLFGYTQYFLYFATIWEFLKLELPLIDADITPLKEYDADSMVKSIENCWQINTVDSNIKLSELPNYYLNPS